MKKLCLRLQSLFDLVDDSYDVIWDLCCDHGYLGLALMQSNRCKHLHFVDCIPSIIESLRLTVEKVPFQTNCTYDLHATSAENISVDSNSNNLIVISGVGGKMAISLMDSIIERNGAHDFLLAPKHNLYEVRSYLVDKGFKLVRESLAEENGRYYENLLVSKNEGNNLSLVGDEMWDSAKKSHESYLKKLLKHYELKGAEKELAHYRELATKKGFNFL